MARGFALASVVLLAVYLLAGIALFHRSPANALFGAFLLMVLHWFNEIWHNYGHFTAARRTGFPMDGVKLGTALLVFGTSVYPPNEQELSARVHIQRALGGPIANAILSAAGVVAILVLALLSSHFVWVAIVFTFENFLVFTVGNFLPFGFNDGSTLLHWMRRR